MKTFKIILITFTALIAVYGLAIIGTSLTVFYTGGKTVGVTQNGYHHNAGDFIISQPVPANQLNPGDLILTAGATTTVGEVIASTPTDAYYLIKVYTGATEADINNYTVQTTAQKITTTIPVIGYLPGVMNSNPYFIAGFVILIIGMVITWNVMFYRKKPAPVPPKPGNQIKILQEMFNEAPIHLTRAELRELKTSTETVTN